ncbi:MAG TPA: DNA mismatch repair endonuclease MutH [Polyangiaceae bacterium]|nr:DNA mismatch repair endonuclease MutH [Polyangiaceae bacterium]
MRERSIRAAVLPPTDEAELLERAARLPGMTLGELATELGVDVPTEMRRAKGWAGQLLERALGASAASRAEPDFVGLGIELKTLPVDGGGRVLESTFVCTIELPEMDRSEWESSRLRKKLARVLWVPVEGARELAPGVRRIGTPFLWSPNEDDEALLRHDWEEAASMIGRGRTSELTAHTGEVLQVRPKAARGSSRRRALDEEGALYDEQPKGFYLRATFTASLLRRHLWVG